MLSIGPRQLFKNAEMIMPWDRQVSTGVSILDPCGGIFFALSTQFRKLIAAHTHMNGRSLVGKKELDCYVAPQLRPSLSYR
jgi:hypothetical protein